MNNFSKLNQINLKQFSLNKNINDFINTIDLTPSSKITYNSQLKGFAAWWSKKQSDNKLDEQIIINYCDHLKNDRHFSDLTMYSYIATLKSFFAWLHAIGRYADITQKIILPQKISNRRKESLTGIQVKTILSSIDRTNIEGKRDFALINLMIWTGLRCNEIIKALKGDIANCCGSQLLWVQTKKGIGKDENILLTDKLFGPINDYLEARRSMSDTEPLFASHSKKNFGQPLTTRSISRIIKNRLKDARIDSNRISANSLRYTAVRLNLLSWATPEQASSMIQTADIDTMLIYTRRLKNKYIK